MLLFSIFTLAQTITTNYPRVNIKQFNSGVLSAGMEGKALGVATDQQGHYQSCSLFVVRESEDASPKLGV